jgi:phosphoribosylanthranilate isomerase
MYQASQTRVIKICGITAAEDARTAFEAGATAIGLNFYPPSPRYISPEQAHRIASDLPRDLLRVGVFVNPTLDQIFRYAQEVPLDIIQIHGRFSCGGNTGLRIWRAVAVDAGFEAQRLSALELEAEALLLDSPTPAFGGSGVAFNWSCLKRVSQRFLLAGGLDPSNVERAIATAKPWGVDACSGLESEPGKKDACKVREFVAAALRAFLALENAA